MKRHRFYCRPITKPITELTGSEARHASTVLRHKVGDRVELFDGAGTLAQAEIQTLTAHRITLAIQALQTLVRPNRCQVVIACSLAKGERFDWLISKCTELGVDRICPVRFARTVKLARGEKVTERYVKLAIVSAKQSERLFLPRIDRAESLKQSLENLTSESSETSLLYGSPNPNAPSLLLQEDDVSQILIVFIGPEGGLTPEEEQLLNEHGAREVRITDTVLRIETAAVAAAAILCTRRDSLC